MKCTACKNLFGEPTTTPAHLELIPDGVGILLLTDAKTALPDGCGPSTGEKRVNHAFGSNNAESADGQGNRLTSQPGGVLTSLSASS
jgi:hypothetical protein